MNFGGKLLWKENSVSFFLLKYSATDKVELEFVEEKDEKMTGIYKDIN